MATTVSFSVSSPPTLPLHSIHRRCSLRPPPASFFARPSFRPVAGLVAARAGSRTPARAAVQVFASSSVMEAPEELATRKLYVGNIPRTVTNDELRGIFADHGTVLRAEVMYDKYSGRSRRFGFITMSSPEEANAAIESLNDTEIGGRKIKVNVTESFLPNIDPSTPDASEPAFVDSQYKVYVGNLAKTVTAEVLKNFFSEKGEVLGATVSRIPGTPKSKGYGFVTFSSEEEVEAAVSAFNNAELEGQPIRVNRA